jgi:hypothetical protein
VESRALKAGRLAERRAEERRKRIEARQARKERIGEKGAQAGRLDGEEESKRDTMVSGASDKWRKRDVSVGEARERFTALVIEFKDGQKVGETSLADTDDLDREAPEEVVQGVSLCVFSELGLMDGKAVVEDILSERDKSFGDTCASGTLEAKKLSITGTFLRRKRKGSADGLANG